jgi:uncharacterized membrane protein YvbJ
MRRLSCFRSSAEARDFVEPRLGTVPKSARFHIATRKEIPMRSVLLWAIGIPIPLIIILWLITGHA